MVETNIDRFGLRPIPHLEAPTSGKAKKLSIVLSNNDNHFVTLFKSSYHRT